MLEHRPPGEALVSVDQAAKRLDCSRPTVYRLLAEGELRSLTIGRSRKILASSVDALISRRSRPPGGAEVASAAAVLVQRTCDEQQLDVQILAPDVLAKVAAVIRVHNSSTEAAAS